TSGPTGGGTSVTITGTNFTAASTVKFGLTTASGVVVNSSTSITVPSPATLTPATVDVSVTNTAGTSPTSGADQSTYNAVQPAVTSISPTSGPTGGGTSVAITGTNFINGATVAFGLTASATVTVNSATSITAVSPPTLSPGTVDVIVTTSGGTSTNTVADDFTYTAVTPSVSSVSPNNGPSGGGTSVTITGTNFITGATVAFGATAATNVTVVSSTSITATSPATISPPSTVDVRVTTSGGTSPIVAADHFTYNVAQPVVTSLNPTSGPTAGGTSVTITGTNFITGATVSFGGTAATSVTLNSPT